MRVTIEMGHHYLLKIGTYDHFWSLLTFWSTHSQNRYYWTSFLGHRDMLDITSSVSLPQMILYIELAHSVYVYNLQSFSEKKCTPTSFENSSHHVNYIYQNSFFWQWRGEGNGQLGSSHFLVFAIFCQGDRSILSWASHLTSQGQFLHLKNKGVGLIHFQGMVYLQILFFVPWLFDFFFFLSICSHILHIESLRIGSSYYHLTQSFTYMNIQIDVPLYILFSFEPK